MKPEQMLVIGLVGERRSGKDTVCEILQKISNQLFIRAAFADELKREVAGIFGISLDHLNRIKTNPLVRHSLQWYGTDYIRFIEGDDYWIKKLTEKVMSVDEYFRIVTDVRFVNEAKWVRSFPNHILFRVVRPNTQKESADAHASETELKSIDADYIINNSGDLCDLNLAVCDAYKKVVLPKVTAALSARSSS